MDVPAEWSNEFLETQKSEICELMKTQLSQENTWYLIDVRWFKQWKKYVGFDEWETSTVGEATAFPGPIDNSMLFKDDGTLRESLTDEIDYALVPKAAWDKLVSWYDLQEGQEPIKRHVIEQGMFVKHHKVEIYYLDLQLCTFSELSKVVKKQFSHADTIATLEQTLREVFSIPSKRDIHLWSCYVGNTFEPLTRTTPDNTLQDAGLYSGQTVSVEIRNEDGSWTQPRTIKSSASTNVSYIGTRSTTSTATNMSNSIISNSTNNSVNTATNRLYSSAPYGSSYDGYRNNLGPGLCGLGNLGNTCFMNSAIQCLSNVPALTNHMTKDYWRQELNVDNPLGMRGEIASTYAELIKIMWSGKCSYTIPRNFKIAVGRFKPEFSGYQQQDSQELMAFLLDGLHEDLNRIKKKPYIETKEANDRPDKVVAEEAWSDYIKRNDSIIVDIFHGLLKSTLVCPKCAKVSVKFDPFCYLSLPLPVKKERQIEIILVPWSATRKLKQYKVTVPKLGMISQLCSALSPLAKIPPEKMLVVDVYNHRFHRTFSPSDSVTHILERDDIFVYELPVDFMTEKDFKLIPVYMRLDRSQLFGVPVVIVVRTKNCTYETLYNCTLDRMERVLRRLDVRQMENDSCDQQSLSDDNNIDDDEGSVQSNGDKTETKSSESASSEDNDDNGGEDEDISDCDERHENQATSNPPSRVFSLSFVNNYGNTEVARLYDDDKPIKFGSQYIFMAADWSLESKQRYYDEKLAEDLDVDESMSNKLVAKKQNIQLSDCLELFTTRELLGEHDLWFCPVCKEHEQATKKFDIWQLPRVLVIHLKRFSYTRYWRDKLDMLVDFPTRGLDMSHWVINPEHGPAIYDLRAISNHYGGMGGGHYTAYAKNKLDNSWYHFDDSSVSSVSEDSVVTKAGYVLVYERRDDPGKFVDRPLGRSLLSSAVRSDSMDSYDTDDEDGTMETN